MKATELMTGDLVRVCKDVCFKKGTIVKIHGIDADHVFPEKGLKGVASCMQVNNPDGRTSGVWLDYLEPIPLTAEILEQNGFVTKDKPDDWKGYRSYNYMNGLKGVSFKVYHDTGKYEWSGTCEISLNCMPYFVRFKYLHELQNILRTYGIDKEITIKED